MPLDYVRVADLDTGHKLSVPVAEVANGRYRVLDNEAAVNSNGDPLGAELNAIDPEPAGDDPADDGPGYDRWKKQALEDEVAKRNAVREDDDHIEVAAPGNKAELVAALVADDANHDTPEV